MPDTARPGDQYAPARGGHHTPQSFARKMAANEAAARGTRIGFEHPVPDWVPEELRHAVGYLADRGWHCLAAVNCEPGEILLPAEQRFVPVAEVVKHQWFIEGDLRRVRVAIPGDPSPVGKPQR
ncbi:hypothetical protein F4561_002741 [Lipingzhangella halophila]|uniref:Uncharacterized protein n=1 Tax=Lipingzhangella halophila TaxID=1783352 RepID=A0A7W7W2M4_9ACTN|nr:hypothetical protein [Lipingzhangella halophila]MBB4931921.1 hypothetical protein [Lipingzhangella halophila]